MVDSGCERKFGRLEGIVGGEGDVQEENSAWKSCTVRPRSPFYIASYYIKLVKTSWTYRSPIQELCLYLSFSVGLSFFTFRLSYGQVFPMTDLVQANPKIERQLFFAKIDNYCSIQCSSLPYFVFYQNQDVIRALSSWYQGCGSGSVCWKRSDSDRIRASKFNWRFLSVFIDLN